MEKVRIGTHQRIRVKQKPPRILRQRSKTSRHYTTVGFLLVIPSVTLFLTFATVPILIVFVTSFSNWTGFDVSKITWAGFSNYQDIIHDTVFWIAFRNTILFTIVTTLFLNTFGFILALIINSGARFTGFLKAVIFLPVLMSPVIVGLMWSNLLGGYGAVNQILQSLNLTSMPIFFLGDSTWALWSIVLATIWQFSGYDMILYHAGLQNVPDNLIEAALIDGASRLEIVRHIILPYLRPVISVVALLNIIGGLRIFDIVFIMTRGGPNRATEVLTTYMYEKAFKLNYMGPASVLAVVIIVMAMITAVLRMRGSRNE